MRRLGIAYFPFLSLILGAVFLSAQGYGQSARLAPDVCRDPRTMTVQVQSKTPGADVHVDARLVGQTPATVCLGPGQHALRVSHRGFGGESWELQLQTLPGSKVTLEANLESGFAGLPREELYRASVAVVWALGGIEDDKPCRRALTEYEQRFGSVSAEARSLIESTYLDLMGQCSGEDPRREVRERVRRDYLHGMEVNY